MNEWMNEPFYASFLGQRGHETSTQCIAYAPITRDDQRLRSLHVRVRKIFERKTAAQRTATRLLKLSAIVVKY